MPFNEPKTLVNLESDVQIDVESLARIEISDVEYLLESAYKQKDSRLNRILYETMVFKTSSVFQLAQRAGDYLELGNTWKTIRDSYPKDAASGIGAVARFRDELFHSGSTFVDKEMFFPFGRVSGRGYVAIRVKDGGTLNIQGLHTFISHGVEYAITSEGIYEIQGVDSQAEKWNLIDPFPSITATNYDEIEAIIKDALAELKDIWYKLSKIRKHGDGKHEYAFINKGGKLEVMEAGDAGVTTHTPPGKSLVVKGNLSFNPPAQIEVKGNKLVYKA